MPAKFNDQESPGPDRLVAELRKRATANPRSLQGEPLTLLEESVERDFISIEELGGASPSPSCVRPWTTFN